jgi:hypothetical protein
VYYNFNWYYIDGEQKILTATTANVINPAEIDDDDTMMLGVVKLLHLNKKTSNMQHMEDVLHAKGPSFLIENLSRILKIEISEVKRMVFDPVFRFASRRLMFQGIFLLFFKHCEKHIRTLNYIISMYKHNFIDVFSISLFVLLKCVFVLHLQLLPCSKIWLMQLFGMTSHCPIMQRKVLPIGEVRWKLHWNRMITSL